MSAPVFVIMGLTLREASRRRLLLAAMFLTLVLVAASTWVFGRLTDIPCGGGPCSPTEVKLLAGTLVILITFMYSFVFALGAVFVAVPTVAAEVESGISQAMLPRPLRRSDVILGKWLGWGIIVSGYTIATAGLEFAAVGAITGYTPPYPLTAIAFLVGERAGDAHAGLVVQHSASPYGRRHRRAGALRRGLDGWHSPRRGRTAGERCRPQTWAWPAGSCCPPMASGAARSSISNPLS